MNTIQQVYNTLLKSFSRQGWWPLLDDNLVCRHTGRAPETDDERFEIVCGVILTQNTNWYPNVTRALQQLKLGRTLNEKEKEILIESEIRAGEIAGNNKKTAKIPKTNFHDTEPGITLKGSPISIAKIKNIKKEKLAQLVRPAGYYNQKAERLKIIAEFLEKNKDPTREQLLNVKGIGHETADSILLYAYNKPFFVIDAYTKRIFERLGYKEDDYDRWQQRFMKNLPKDTKIFNEYHALMVELGKNNCRKKPVCEGCPIKGMCK
ncbi:endonuclease [Candidatus Woesearchaeota archaeon]|nr:endonuclease [Candidatus Woesearchaeota archaeon]